MRFHSIRITLGCLALLLIESPSFAQSFRVQCPNGTTLHPALVGTTGKESVDSMIATDPNRPTWQQANPQIKCQHVSGGDGFATMADGHQIYTFGFGPLSGIENIEAGVEGTVAAGEFNHPYPAFNAKHTSGGPLLPTELQYLSHTNAAVTEPAEIMNLGVMAAQSPAPAIAVDEDDELFLTLSNVGMIMRPDLFEQHTIHWHGYPQASSYFDGVPDASVAINIAGSFTYYYTAPDAGTYFWHCHITPPEHLQMGMVGQLWVRPRQDRLPAGANLRDALFAYEYPAGRNGETVVPNSQPGGSAGYPGVSYPSSNCDTDFLCTMPVPAANTVTQGVDGSGNPDKYAYDDGDGSTRYDVEYAIQEMGYDPNFHFVGMTFNPEPFKDMQDKYFLLDGRGYPDTVGGASDANGNAVPGPLETEDSDGASRVSQPLPSLIVIDKTNKKQTKALLRLSNLSVTHFHYLSTTGVPMEVIAHGARMLRDLAGNDMGYGTNSVEIGGGDNIDVMLDASNVDPGTYFLYASALDELSNDAENYGGMMTEIIVK